MKITTRLTQLALLAIALFLVSLAATFNPLALFSTALAALFLLVTAQDYAGHRYLHGTRRASAMIVDFSAEETIDAEEIAA